MVTVCHGNYNLILLTKRNPLGMVVLLPFASGKAEMLQL
jgi:hypothetical protein